MAAPYDRLRAETPPAFAAFVVYRDMGSERSLSKAARSLGKSKQLLDGWSSKHRWVKRSNAWDMEADRRQREAQLKELEQMRARQINLAVNMQGLGAKELQKMITLSEGSDAVILRPDDLLRLIKEGTIIERLNRGEPGEIVQSVGDGADLSGLSVDELRAMKRVHKKLRKQNE